jgi:hypothetical protein
MTNITGSAGRKRTNRVRQRWMARLFKKLGFQAHEDVHGVPRPTVGAALGTPMLA